MGRKLSLDLGQDTLRELTFLAESLGYPEEMAAVYAIRLVSACVREGLLADVPARAWPREARLAGAGEGKVLAFAPARKKRERPRRQTEMQ